MLPRDVWPRSTVRRVSLSSPVPRPRPALLTLAYLAFVSLGLPDAVLGVAWPSLRDTFGLSQAAMGAILGTAAVAYFTSGLLAGRLMRALNLGLLLALSTGSVALGLTGYATVPLFVLFLAAACFIGFGSGAIDSALNNYAAQNFGPKHMAWLHAAYSVGAAMGPVLMTALLARGAGWRTGYAVLAGVLGTLALTFLLMRRLWDAPVGAPGEEPRVEVITSSAMEAVRRPRVWLQIFTFFFYTGVEVTAGQWSFTVLTEGRGLHTAAAGTCVSIYWGSLLVGRVLSGFVVEHLRPVRMLHGSTALAVVGAALFAIPAVPPALGLALLGLALAPIFPALMSETPRRVGLDVSAHAVGFQVSAATTGVAALPSLAGIIAERWGLQFIAPYMLGVAVVLALLHGVLSAVADRPQLSR
ncbi:major facilitator superfamily protein [Corallococcus coralloides]|uniref:Major facilitator superfamily protein n=1 Tax=Corallococcus coralloides TaxID=184914 RepID=A0A410RUD1_CORCK|nr:MFS transporter [Corallococcus coralloides]QAT85421.1 major facilitator superfamily protein [Corallococcus coralloides]